MHCCLDADIFTVASSLSINVVSLMSFERLKLLVFVQQSEICICTHSIERHSLYAVVALKLKEHHDVNCTSAHFIYLERKKRTLTLTNKCQRGLQFARFVEPYNVHRHIVCTVRHSKFKGFCHFININRNCECFH